MSANDIETYKLIENKIKKLIKSDYLGTDEKSDVIVSLTSFPERIDEIKYTIYSLLNQTFKPNKIILWLADSQFPQKEKSLPKDLLRLCRHGLEIGWTKDIRSYKKIIPTLEKYPDFKIVTADDDIYYHESWLEELYTYHLLYPEEVIAHRCHFITLNKNKINDYKGWNKCIIDETASFRNFCTSGGGVLYPPHCFYKDVNNEQLFMKLCPMADDIWLWGMCVLNGMKIRNISSTPKKLVIVNLNREIGQTAGVTLGKYNVLKKGNDKQFKAFCKYYPKLKEQTLTERKRKVSIIVPVWNAEKYLSKCLDSLANQTLKEIEIICVNDESSDHSLDILNSYAERDSRFVILNQKNQGQSVARNNAMSIARGEFIGFCDNDDWVSPNYFEDLYLEAKRQNCDIAATPNVFYVDPDTSKLERKATGIPLGKEFTKNRASIVKTTGLQWNKIYKATYLKKHDIKCTTIRVAAEDNYFTTQAMMYCDKIAISPQSEYYFYRGKDATSKLRKKKSDFCVVDLYQSIDQIIGNSTLSESDKKDWLTVMNDRKTRDLSLFYNEMLDEYKFDFENLVRKTFPEIKLKKVE